jgi:siroheme synthase (precorrin-2 oxidase/ferrochelatase)
MSFATTLLETLIHIREYENRLRKIENGEWRVSCPLLCIPYLKAIIKEKRLVVLLIQTKKDNKTLVNMIKEKLRQSITERMEYTTELVEVQGINENQYLQLSNEMKELYDIL